MALKQGRGWDAEIQGNISCVLYYTATLERHFIATDMAGPLFLPACIYFGRSKFKNIKHYVTTVHSYGQKIVLVQLTTHPKQIAIYLYCDSCKNFVRRRAITILARKAC